MDIRSHAVAVIRRAESEVRELLLRAAKQGDYGQVATVAQWAQQLRQIIDRADSAKGSPEPGEEVGAQADVTPQTPSMTAPLSAADGLLGPRPRRVRHRKEPGHADYPRFHRERDELVKTGWSKKRKGEYRHKAPKTVVLSVAEILQRAGSTGERFTVDELLPFRDRETGSELPSYQAYLTLAWLRKEELIVQHGRQGYSLPRGINLLGVLEERWKRLQTEKSRS